jgi:septation ring formation regulator EzrA
LIPYFPEHVFDGTYDQRPNLQEIRPPDYDDYIRLSKEISATQEFILTKLANLQAVPEALTKLQIVYQKAEKLEKRLENCATPDEMDSYINSVEAKLDKLIEKVTNLQKALARTTIEYSNLQERVETIEKGWETDVSAFQKYNRGEFARLKESVKNSLDELKKQIQSLKDILGS